MRGRCGGLAALGLAALCGLGGTGCVTQPAVPAPGTVALPARYAALAPPEAPVPQDWQRLLPDPALQRLLAAVEAGNIDLRIATARLAASRASARAAAATRRPAVNVDTSARRERNSLEDPRSGGAVNQPGFRRDLDRVAAEGQLQWELDFFGADRAREQAAVARSEAQGAQVQALRLSLLAEAGQRYSALRAVQMRLLLTAQSLELEGEVAAITRAKLRGGQLSAVEVRLAEAQQSTTAAQRQGLRVQQQALLKDLALLLGSTPAETAALLGDGALLPLSSITLSAGAPAELLRRRPDVVEAERQLAAASAEVASAARDAYPRLSLSASLGWVAGSASALLGASAFAGGLGPALSWQALDFGRNAARVDERSAEVQQAFARYQQAALTAFAEAETALQQAETQRARLAMAEAATQADREAWELIQTQYRAGLVDLGAVLDVRRQLNSSQDAEVAAQEQLYAAFFTLLKALGGPWPVAGAAPSD